MALNLWKLGGQPTNYSPLPLGTNNKVQLQLFKEYTIRFKAKSDKGGTVRFHSFNMVNDVRIDKVLTSSFQVVEASWYESENGFVWLQDLNNAGDIIIENIELVQKPLPKLTINGIDGFLSGKWNLHTNAKAIDNETLELNATGNGNTSKFVLDIIPNTPYVISFENLNGRFFLELQASDNSYVGTHYNISSNVYTFTTHKSAVKLTIGLYNDVLGVGKFTFKKPMLNMGSVPAPYEKKKGERMVLPVARKNLFDGLLLGGSHYSPTGELLTGQTVSLSSVNVVPVKPNTSYTISNSKGFTDLYVLFRDINKNAISRAFYYNTPTFVTPSNCYYIHFFWVGTRASLDLDTKVMFVEGTTPSAYEPYAVQVNKKPQRYVPKKNLFDGVWESGLYDSVTGAKNPASAIRSVNFIPIKPNTTYATNLANGGRVSFWTINQTFISSTPYTSGDFTFLSPNNAAFAKFYCGVTDLSTKTQFEEGNTVTPYEPYQLALPKARTGLVMDGVSNYAQLPSMTMDAIEIDCLIDSVQSNSFYLFDARKSNVDAFLLFAPNGAYSKTDLRTNKLMIDGVELLNGAKIPFGQRIKTMGTFKEPLTASPNIFASYVPSFFTKGTLYRVTCYLNGQVVAQYDFENPNNIVGDKVLQSASINVNKVSKNIFDKTKSTLGKYINVTGWLADSGTSDVSDYMPVEAGASYIVTGYANGANTPYAWFDDRKGEVSLSGGTSVWEAIVAPAGAKYLRITVPKANADTFMVEKGTVRTAYEPYYKIVENVVPNVKNLIPSFEDARWNLHSNFKVLGRDVGRLDASTATIQLSTINCDIEFGKTYNLLFSQLNSYWKLVLLDSNGVVKRNLGHANFLTFSFTPNVGENKLRFELGNFTGATGSFDFIRPQLYELTGKEATIVGRAIPLRRSSKRTLYSKR